MSVETSPLLSPLIGLINRIDSIRQTDYRARLISLKTGFHSSSYRFSKDKLAFIHIPKTGGTSISALLEQLDCSDRLVNLHMHRPISRHCPPSQYDYFTMIRHPIGRVYSYYKMAERQDPDNPYGHLCRRGIEHFITHCWETRNLCCRYIAGNTRNEVNEETFKIACDNLLNFKWVGLFEHFDDSVEQLCNLMNQSRSDIPHYRQSPEVKPCPEEVSVIEKYNEFDLRLYQFFLQERSGLNPS